MDEIKSGIRLQKYLAESGFCSRRKGEIFIADGKVTINKKTARLGDRVQEHDLVLVDGQKITSTNNKATRVLVYNKPEGEISSRSDPKKQKTVFQNLPYVRNGRWISVGRLDINTQGLLLFTTDGSLAYRLMHPKYKIEREYACRVYGRVDAKIMKKLCSGVLIDGKLARFQTIHGQQKHGKNNWYTVVLSEGRYREVRRLWSEFGCQLSRLIRVRYGPISLPRDLGVGEFRELSKNEILILQDSCVTYT